MSFIWNLYARAYDTINENIPYLKMLKDVTEELDLKDNLKLLDVGCGTANFVYKVFKINPTIEITAVDFSPKMLIVAGKKFSHNVIKLRQLDIEKGMTIFPNNYFDRIVAINVLYTIKDIQKCIKGMYRMLGPGGRIVIANPDDEYSFSAIFSAQLKELGWYKFLMKFIFNLPALIVIIFVNIFFIKKDKYNFLTGEELKILLEEAGFKIQKIERTYAKQDLLINAIK